MKISYLESKISARAFTIFFLTLIVCNLWPVMIAWSISPKAVIKNEIPYGERGSSLLGRGTTIVGLLCVESLSQEDIFIDYEVRMPAPLVPWVKDEDIKIEKKEDVWILKTSFNLKAEGEKWFRPVKITIPEKSPCREYFICATARIRNRGDTEIIRHDARLKVISSKDMRDYFEIGEVIIPSNEKGEPDSRQEQNTFLIREKKKFWQRLALNKKDKQNIGIEPAAYMAVRIKNRTAYKTTLLIRLDISDIETGEKVKGFEYPYAAEHSDLSGEGEIYQMVSVQPKSEDKVVLPIYTEEGEAEPGIYMASVKVFPFGTSTIVGQRDIKINVVSTRLMPLLMTSIALMTAMGGMFFFYRKRR